MARISGCACPNWQGLRSPPMPEDAFYFLGYDEQIVAIVPSRDLVIVRLGLTQYEASGTTRGTCHPSSPLSRHCRVRLTEGSVNLAFVYRADRARRATSFSRSRLRSPVQAAARRTRISFLLTTPSLMGNNSHARDPQLAPSRIVSRTHGIQVVGTKKRGELLERHWGLDNATHNRGFIAEPRDTMATNYAT